MSIRNTVTVIVDRVENGNVSYYGNPSAYIHTSRGTFRSQTDANFVYGIHNIDWRDQKAELTLTPAGRVTNIRKLTKDGLKDEVTDYLIIPNERI